MRTIAVLLVILLSLSACSSTPPARQSHTSHTSPVAVSGSVQQRLVRHFRRWQGVPHKYGGNDRHGIDCSGFVHLTYRELFNTRVPRTTKQLAKIGRSITRKHLRIGDLVLFKIGRRQQRHVGIYLGNGQFVHASSSRGVMQSRLDSPYWSRHYWTARRILK